MAIDFKNNLRNNEEIESTLNNLIDSNSLSNAYIFYGPSGIGKKETALTFISKIIHKNSPDQTINQKIEDNNYPDYLFIEPTYLIQGKLVNRSAYNSNKNSQNKALIRIDQIRGIRKFISRKAIESNKKFVLIQNADLLNEAAANCLLKTLEEPTNGVFILTTSKIHLLLDTITSRCHKIRFKPLAKEDIRTYIEEYSKDLNENLDSILYLDELIEISDGSPQKIIDNINIWSQISQETKEAINLPPINSIQSLLLAEKISSELEINQQLLLLDIMQNLWWKKTKKKNLIDLLETLRMHLESFSQARLSWEAILLKISMKK